MKRKVNVKCFLCFLLSAALMFSLCTTAFAEGAVGSDETWRMPTAIVKNTDSSLCEHHPKHTSECGYQEGTERYSCEQLHDENCRYEEAAGEVSCNMGCIDTDGDGIINHEEGCAYVPAMEGQPCTHIRSKDYGITAEKSRASCMYVCEVCGKETGEKTENAIMKLSTDVGTATVGLRNPEKPTSELTLSQIDIAQVEKNGYQLIYQISINMQNYYADYIQPLVDSGWSKNAEKFTVTFPTELFDESLEINWNEITCYGLGYTKVLKANATDGVVLCGDGTKTSSSNLNKYVSVYIRVPVTLTKEQCEEAFKNGAITLNGPVTAVSPDKDVLEFSVSHNIPIINTAAGSLKVTREDSSDAVPFTDGAWVLENGNYTISGTAQEFESVRVTGNATLTLDSANISHTTTDFNKYAPAISIEAGSNANLILSGDSIVEGSRGYAGIYVAEGASLTISGSGSLAAKGGDGYSVLRETKYSGGGAGIGGNGIWALSQTNAWENTADFGKIIIQSGNITAKGGKSNTANNGAGAGIGSGGSSTKNTNDIATPFHGEIFISGGVIKAEGGDGEDNTLTLGGAGIGSGGSGGQFYTQNNKLQITISGGDITATGIADGAGIGGGANVDGGIISITGGDITATGGCEIEDGEQYGIYGGAGIGGGDNGGVTSISITGGTVRAKAIGAAAGIGSGNGGNVGTYEITARDDSSTGFVGTYTSGNILIDGTADVTADGGQGKTTYVGGAGIGTGYYGSILGRIDIDGNARVAATGASGAAGIGGGFDGDINAKWNAGIHIKGNANVTAFGGSDDEDEFGGAGIGAGASYQYDNGCASISITGNATVCAYAGAKSHAIGVGSDYAGDDANSLTLEDTITLWAQNQGDSDFPALLSVAEAGYDPITYTSANIYLVSNGTATGSANGYLEQPEGNSRVFSYTLDSQKLIIDGNDVPAAAPQGTVGNWATLYSIPTVTVTYQYVGTTPDGAILPSSDTVEPGAYTAKQPGAVEGYVFHGWYLDEDCTSEFTDGAVLGKDTSLYGKWTPKTTPVIPQSAAYKVEHYLEQTDGGYKLEETEFPLYGEIGTMATAVEKNYENYHVNNEASTFTGEIIRPTEENGEVKILVLKIYYDMNTVDDPVAPDKPVNLNKPTDSVKPNLNSGANSPQTGDSSIVLLWIVLLILASSGLSGIVLYSKKRGTI